MGFRKITNKGGVKKRIGKFPSFILNKPIWYEGSLEKDYLYLVEFDYYDLLDIREQSCRFFYSIKGKRRRYTADFVIVRKSITYVVEVKPKKYADEEKYQARFRVADELCNRHGYKFLIMTEVEIGRQPRLDNIKVLIYYQRTPVCPQHQILCHEFFSGRKEASLGEVMDFFRCKSVDKQVVYALLRWGILEIDIDKAICPDSVIYLHQ
jgi:hypothetical protein